MTGCWVYICAGLYDSMVRSSCAMKFLCIVWYVGCCLKSANFILGVKYGINYEVSVWLYAT
jgi:hypothetical protein